MAANPGRPPAAHQPRIPSPCKAPAPRPARPAPRPKPDWDRVERITRAAACLATAIAEIIHETGRILGWW